VVTTPLLPATSASVVDLDPQRMLAELDFELPLDGGQWAQGPPLVKVADMAAVLRTHLEEDDPLASYAATLEQAAYASTPLRGYLTGSIDVVFEHAGRFYVADYKTNWLGPPDQPNTTATYTPPHMRRAMEGSTYPLQALLYTVALHRYLTWRMKDYDVEAHLGGVLYLYVRGMAGPSTPVVDGTSTGVFYWQPPPGLVTELSELLNGADGAAPDRRRE
ncbi:MAG TPA: PD-(D/E)XK nuclease family protein, partial [Beutenbergiaceae bacterium]|nr:PD-(D/E)XK nuclease family protein [Beutenbergiaceae bacterium]